MSIADKKSTHHHHQSVAGHDHHHQTDLSSERERGGLMIVMRREGYGRLLTFPYQFRSQFPTYMLLANRKISNGPYIPRRCSTREGREGGREGGEESGSGLWHLLFSVFCFFFFLVSWHFLGSWYVSSTSPFSSSRVQSDSDELLAITIHAWRSNRQDRTGLVRWVGHHTKRLPNVGIPEQSIKFANSLCWENKPAGLLTCLLYMLCPNIDTCQWGINSLPFSCTYLLCTPSLTLAIAQQQ